MTPTTEQLEAEITRRWNSLSYNPEGVISRESLRHQVLKDFNADYTLEQIREWKEESAELAKQQSIAFAAYTAENLWAVYSKTGMWYQHMNEDNPITGEQLYNQFIEQQNKP